MTPDWKTQGVRIVRAGELDTNTPQSPGMNRAAAINFARVGAEKLCTAGSAKPFKFGSSISGRVIVNCA
jgi:uncharacterized RmlC-like cupin family protein